MSIDCLVKVVVGGRGRRGFRLIGQYHRIVGDLYVNGTYS